MHNANQLGLTDQLLTIKEVSAILKRSRPSIYRDIRKGIFPEPVKIGACSRWRVSDVNVFLDGLAASAA